MKVLLTNLSSQVKSISLSDGSLPLPLKQEVLLDLEEVKDVTLNNAIEYENCS